MSILKRVNLKKATSKILVAAMATALFAGNGVGVLNSKAASGSDIVSVAANQVGYHEKTSNWNLDDFNANSGSGNYTKYARDTGYANGQPWCATFTVWVMRTAGVTDYPNTAWVPSIKSWFDNRGRFHYRGTYTPAPGDYIIFGSSDHVGLVEYVSGGYVHTIEGNSRDSVRRNTYSLSNSYILGYGDMSGGTVVSQADNPGAPYAIPSSIVKNGSRGNDVRWVQTFANEVMGAGLAVDGIAGRNTVNAIRTFQSNYGLTVDGQAGPITINKMLEVWKAQKNSKPEITNVVVSEVSESGYRVTCNVSDNKGVTEVKFPSWTSNNGQDDLIWHVGSLNGNTATFYVSTSSHNNEAGEYITHIYAYDGDGNSAFYGVDKVNVPAKYEETAIEEEVPESDLDSSDSEIEYVYDEIDDEDDYVDYTEEDNDDYIEDNSDEEYDSDADSADETDVADNNESTDYVDDGATDESEIIDNSVEETESVDTDVDETKDVSEETDNTVTEDVTSEEDITSEETISSNNEDTNADSNSDIDEMVNEISQEIDIDEKLREYGIDINDFATLHQLVVKYIDVIRSILMN